MTNKARKATKRTQNESHLETENNKATKAKKTQLSKQSYIVIPLHRDPILLYYPHSNTNISNL